MWQCSKIVCSFYLQAGVGSQLCLLKIQSWRKQCALTVRGTLSQTQSAHTCFSGWHKGCTCASTFDLIISISEDALCLISGSLFWDKFHSVSTGSDNERTFLLITLTNVTALSLSQVHKPVSFAFWDGSCLGQHLETGFVMWLSTFKFASVSSFMNSSSG